MNPLQSPVFQSISIAIIVMNEEHNIADCIDNCQVLGPLTIVDGGSKDNTLHIIKSLGYEPIHRTWTNFCEQKQYAVNNCPTDWVLILDADERLTAPLIQEIKNLDLNDPTIAYAIPRRSFFLGTEVKHCGWRPDYVIRLFNRNHCRLNGRAVHEAIIGFEKVKHLENSLIHYTYRSDADIENKVNLYSELGAQTVSAKRTKILFGEPTLRASWIFLKTFFIKLGILDKRMGFKISQMNCKGTYLKYKKARDLLDLTEQNKKG